jgi:hypothetical protein
MNIPQCPSTGLMYLATRINSAYPRVNLSWSADLGKGQHWRLGKWISRWSRRCRGRSRGASRKWTMNIHQRLDQLGETNQFSIPMRQSEWIYKSLKVVSIATDGMGYGWVQ